MERYRLEEHVCNTCKLKKINTQSLQRTVRKLQIIISHPVGITPVRHRFTPRRLAKMKSSDKVKCWQERTPEHLYSAVGSLNQNTGFWKQSRIIWWSWSCTYLWPSHLTPRYRMFQRNSWACVPGDKIRTFRAAWETTQMLLNRRMHTSVVLYNEMLIISEDEWIYSYKCQEERLTNVIVTEKSKLQKNTCNMMPFT